MARPSSRAWYDRTGCDADGSPIVVIRYGYVGRRMLHSACAAAAAFAHGGNDLVIDEMLLTPDLLPIWMDALAGLDVQLVGATCPLAVAERRERDRSHPAGLARGHFHAVHDHGYTYDISTRLQEHPPPWPEPSCDSGSVLLISRRESTETRISYRSKLTEGTHPTRPVRKGGRNRRGFSNPALRPRRQYVQPLRTRHRAGCSCS